MSNFAAIAGMEETGIKGSKGGRRLGERGNWTRNSENGGGSCKGVTGRETNML